MVTFKDVTWTDAVGTGTNLPVVMPATVNVDDILLAFVWDTLASDSFPGSGVPAGWTYLDSSQGASAFSADLFYKVADGTEDGTTVNWTTRFGTNRDFMAGVVRLDFVQAFANINSFTGFDGFQANAVSVSDTTLVGVLGTDFAVAIKFIEAHGAGITGFTNDQFGTAFQQTGTLDAGGGAVACVMGFVIFDDVTGDQSAIDDITCTWTPAGSKTHNTIDFKAQDNVQFSALVTAPPTELSLRLLKTRAKELPFTLHTRMQ